MIIEAFSTDHDSYLPMMEDFDNFMHKKKNSGRGNKHHRHARSKHSQASGNNFVVVTETVQDGNQADRNSTTNPYSSGTSTNSPDTGGASQDQSADSSGQTAPASTDLSTAQAEPSEQENSYDNFDDKSDNAADSKKATGKNDTSSSFDKGALLGFGLIILTGVIAVGIAVMVGNAEKRIKVNLGHLKHY